MVDVNTQNKTISVNVSSSGVSSNVNASGDYSYYYSEKAREWAISNRIVDGVDYSSKYYAGRANQSALNAQNFAQSAQDSYNDFQQSVDGALSNIDSSVQIAITTIDTKSDEAIETINNAVDGVIEDIEAEANEQIANIERTGFYMRDDKLYFINSQGEETEFKSGGGDTIPLFTGLYFDFKPNNASWLKGGEQKNRAGIYETTYDELVECLTGVNKYDLKVINIGDMVAGVDYSEYWKLDQDNMVFQTPTAISNKALSGAVMGNGMALGLTNGSQNFGLRNFTLSAVHIAFKDAYGVPVGQYSSQAATNADKAVGVTTDPTKSGIVVEQSTAQLYFKVANAVTNLELLNVGEVTEALADKIGRQDCPAYITEAYVNGTSGYNLYSNGYCEQWGICNGSNTNTKTTLLKNYKDTNYIVNISFNNNINSSADVSSFWGSYLQAHNKTVSSFYSFCQGANTQFGTVWRACGYIS